MTGFSGPPAPDNNDLSQVPNGIALRKVVAANAPSTTYGAIGTYAFLAKRGTGFVVAGSTYAGSGLVPAGVYVNSSITDNGIGFGSNSALGVGSGALSGTWRAMGSFTRLDASNFTRATIFVRIS